MTMSPAPVEVFFSFVETDAPLLRRLENHLSGLLQTGVITTWNRRQIVVGSDWQKEMDSHLDTASLIIFLISSEFLASGYQDGAEFQRAVERQDANQALVIPILLRPCDWKHTPFGNLMTIPRNEKAVTSWRSLDAAFTNIAGEIRAALEDAQQLMDNPLHARLQKIWNVPYLRNPHFTGRDELFKQLDQQFSLETQDPLSTTRRAALTQPQAIKGLGGIGKTQIAIEYAYRSRDLGSYTYIFWVSAANEETLLADFVALADLLALSPMKRKKDQRELVAAIKHWLEQCQQRWLLIFDNADDVALVHGYLPQGGNGSILLTTRADAVGSLAMSLPVDNMDVIEGMQFLLHRAQREQASDEESNTAINVVNALYGFPLALDQAGSYIEETKCSFDDYLQTYQKHRDRLLAERGMPTTDYLHPVATTWSLSFQKVEQVNPAATELLRLSAFLAPDHIPEELLKDGAAYWPPLLQLTVADPLTFNEMIRELLKFSLVKRLAEDRILSIHRLVQAVQMEALGQEEQRHWAERVIRAVNQVFPTDPNDVTTLSQSHRYLDQVQACNALIEKYGLLLDEGANLLDRASVYLIEQAFYSLAEPLEERAQAIREQLLNIALFNTALSKNTRAEYYRSQGQYENAEPFYLRALADFVQVDSAHIETAVCRSNLALLYTEVARYEDAELLCLLALPILKQQLGDKHPKTVSCINNLANLYYRQGKYEDAEPLYILALAGWDQQGEILVMAISLNNLGELYRIQKREKEAEVLFQRARVIFEEYEKELKNPHPIFAYTLNNLALLYHEQGNYEEAGLFYERALNIFEQNLQDIHPDKVGLLSNLANLYYRQGKYEKAEPLLKRALLSYRQTAGVTDPYTQNLQKGYDTLLQILGHDEDGRESERDI